MKIRTRTEPRNELGRLVRDLRETRGITGSDLSRKIGKSPSYVSGIECGTIVNISAMSLAQLARELGASAREVVSIGRKVGVVTDRQFGLLFGLEEQEQLSLTKITSVPKHDYVLSADRELMEASCAFIKVWENAKGSASAECTEVMSNIIAGHIKG
jgi:transcriptional regulator with XRE-family HTH domain